MESLRLRVLHQGLQDMRALQLLESLTDRATVEALIERELGMRITFKRYPHRGRAAAAPARSGEPPHRSVAGADVRGNGGENASFAPESPLLCYT